MTKQNNRRRRLGIYYTPDPAARLMTDWVIASGAESVLEPSFGDGVFIRSLADSARANNWRAIDVHAVEIDDSAAERLTIPNGLRSVGIEINDFLSVKRPNVDAVVGNPPFVRLRHLAPDARTRAELVGSELLGRKIEPSGSLWLPFVLHAAAHLKDGGSLALVIPQEALHVRYARPLWSHFAARFGDLRVVRVRERIFSDLMQRSVILFAARRGDQTRQVRYERFLTMEDLIRGENGQADDINISEFEQGHLGVAKYFLPPKTLALVESLEDTCLRPLSDYATIRIGYVAGDKEFFHPSQAVADHYNISRRSLRPSVTSTRALRGGGIWSSRLPKSATRTLFLPQNSLSEGEKRYISEGETRGVSSRYKCRVRRPWHIVPGVRVPDFLLTVFSTNPLLIVNDGKFTASNSLLCGYLKPEAPAIGTGLGSLASSWYTSLTQLQCELKVHSLGGGVLVMVPREANAIFLPPPRAERRDHLQTVDQLVRDNRLERAYSEGDEIVLRQGLGLSRRDVELIRAGVEELGRWRAS